MSYYVSQEEFREHQAQHRPGGRVTRRKHYCGLCYPRRNRQTTRAFNRFWNWISISHNAETYTGYTVESFNHIYARRDIAEPDEVINSVATIISSVRYMQ